MKYYKCKQCGEDCVGIPMDGLCYELELCDEYGCWEKHDTAEQHATLVAEDQPKNEGCFSAGNA